MHSAAPASRAVTAVVRLLQVRLLVEEGSAPLDSKDRCRPQPFILHLMHTLFEAHATLHVPWHVPCMCLSYCKLSLGHLLEIVTRSVQEATMSRANALASRELVGGRGESPAGVATLTSEDRSR